jgi:hypothetical protein
MGFVVVVVVSFVVCTAGFGLLIFAMELTPDYWFPEDPLSPRQPKE